MTAEVGEGRSERVGPLTESAEQHAGPPEMVVVTGMSGAGRSTVAKVLEDLDWFVVDNLPPELIPTMAELGGRAQGAIPRIAVVVDVRGRAFFKDLSEAIGKLRNAAIDPRVVFLEADDASLVRRFESVRRRHPLQAEERLIDGIAREREQLRDLRGEADLVIDTSSLNVHELRAKVEQAFGAAEAPSLHATVVSFGYKYGLPVDADLVVDCRFLPNPHWVPELRPRTGLDPEVSKYVFSHPEAEEFLQRYSDVLGILAPGYLREGKRYLTIAVGCTGGKHRSVAMSEEIGRRLNESGVETHVVHRDMGRE